MKKLTKIILAIFLVMMTFNPLTAQATSLNDGEYTIHFNWLDSNGNVSDKLNNYVENPATLYVDNGTMEIELTIQGTNVLTEFKVNGTEPTVVSESENSKVVKFVITDLTASEDISVRVEIPSINYDHTYEMQMKFDTSSITAVYIPDVDGDDTSGEDGDQDQESNQDPDQEQEATEESGGEVTLADGEYTVSINTVKTDSDETYPMMSYFENPVTLKVENGKHYVYLKIIKGSSMIPYLEYEANGSYVKMEEVITATNESNSGTRIVKFEADNIGKATKTKVIVSAGSYQSVYEFRIVADTTTIQEVQQDVEVEEEETETEQGLKDGEYTIPFTFLTEDGATTDKMDKYVVNPAKLMVKDGRNYVTFTLLSTNIVTGFKVEQNGTLVDPAVLSSSGNTKVVQFEVKDLDELFNVSAKIDIAALNYHHEYPLQVKFETSGITVESANDTTDQPETDSADSDEGTLESEDTDVSSESTMTEDLDETTEESLEFDRNGDDATEKITDNSETNAKTFDGSQLGIYLSLLVGSFLLLVRQYRTRSL